MKVTNQELVNIYTCLFEGINSKEAKKELSESGKITYAFVKSYNLLTPTFKALVDLENGLKDAAKKASTEENKIEISKALQKDLNELFAQEQEITVHKISKENCDIIQKYLSGQSTIALYSFLMLPTPELVGE